MESSAKALKNAKRLGVRQPSGALKRDKRRDAESAKERKENYYVKE
jgi:hypothetical protein